MKKIKAYRTRCPAIGNGCGIVKTESADKAKYAAYLSAQDAGFDRVKITDFGARRAQEYDNATYCGKPIPLGRCFGEEFLEIN